jgi:hypothetical protein
METLPLFPIDDLYIVPTVVEPEPEDEPEPEPACAVLPGQLDLFTGEVAA